LKKQKNPARDVRWYRLFDTRGNECGRFHGSVEIIDEDLDINDILTDLTPIPDSDITMEDGCGGPGGF